MLEMRNLVKEKIEANGYVLGAFVASSSATNCEILAINGLDFVIIDCEHAQTNPETVVHMCRASEMYGMAPIIRVYNPSDGPMMTRMIDVGVHGVMAPLVDTTEQAKRLVASTKYPPLGRRGANNGRGPRWNNYPDYLRACNDNILAIAQCESAESVRNIDEIAALPGIDGIFIGVGDLAMDLAAAKGDSTVLSLPVNSPEVTEAIERVLAVCKDHGIIPGIVTGSAEDAAARIRQGFQFVTCMNDLGFFSSRSKQHLEQIRQLAAR